MYEVPVRSGKGVTDPAQGKWMEYSLLKVTYCPVCSLLWILCLPITTQADVLTTLISHQALSGECSSFSPQHPWSPTLPTGAFPREPTGASSACTAALACAFGAFGAGILL